MTSLCGVTVASSMQAVAPAGVGDQLDLRQAGRLDHGRGEGAFLGRPPQREHRQHDGTDRPDDEDRPGA